MASVAQCGGNAVADKVKRQQNRARSSPRRKKKRQATPAPQPAEPRRDDLPVITDRQAEVLCAMSECMDADVLCRPPTIRRLAIMLGIARSTAFEIRHLLREAGCLNDDFKLTDTGARVVVAWWAQT